MSSYPDNYNLWNNATSKLLNVVVQIQDVSGTYSSGPLYDENYLLKTDNKMYLLLDQSSLDISQTIEPEQGKGSISTVTLVLLDKNQEITQLCSPGIIVDDILGKEITVYVGYQNTRFRDDYFVIFRGYISEIYATPGTIRISTADSNSKRRSAVFNTAQTKLTAGINNSQTNIPVVNTSDFHVPIQGPDGNYDAAVQCAIQVNQEYMFYDQTGIAPTAFTVTRGELQALPYSAGPADVANLDDTVTAAVLLTDHCIDMALKVMLSGWNGNWISGEAITDLGIDLNTQTITLPNQVDAQRDYGLVLGDYVTISGATNVGNNITTTIIGFAPLNGQLNRLLVVNFVFTPEAGTPATVAFRSQFDTYPVSCGLRLTPKDVDVARHLNIKTTFLSGPQYSYQFLIQSIQNGKDWLESQIYLPYSMYSVTRFGRCSLGITEPPIGGQDIQFLNGSNILNAQTLTIKRSTINRRFYNLIQIAFDENVSQEAQTTTNFLDTNSLNIIGTLSTLPINSSGGRTALGSDTAFLSRADKLLERYKNVAIEIEVEVRWQQGSKIEVGDVIALQDDVLQISNFTTGRRGLGTQLFEVIKRTLSIKSGKSRLTLIGGVSANAYDRFGVIGPSSEIVAVGADYVTITDSYFTDFPYNEQAKWIPYLGQEIRIHTPDWSYEATFTLIGFDPANPYNAILSGYPPSFISGMILDMPEYPNSPYPYFDGIWKTIHCFFDPQVEITSNSADGFGFFVSLTDVTKFFVGSIVIVHSSDFTSESVESVVTATDLITGFVTVNIDLGLTPTTGMLVDLIGFFPDQQPPYRIL